MSKKTVIIGGVAGGATAAARLRRRDESRQIILFERGEYISYANCGLPYYIGDAIKSRDALLLQSPEGMKGKFNIDVKTSHEVVKIRPGEKTVLVRNLKTGEEFLESYDDLVIATGSSPLVPPIPGIDGPGIHTLWTVPDTDAIKRVLKEESPRRAAVIGGGFIGLEMAENLHRAGIKVTIIELQDQVMAPFDYEMAMLLQENIAANQVDFILGDGVKSFARPKEATVITLNSGKQVEADLVLLSIGVRPNSALAKEAGIEVNDRGGILVDPYLRTSKDHIYAVGDVIAVDQYVTGRSTMIPLAGPANKQARICADNLAGDHKAYRGTLGTSVAKVFDYTAASVGVNEKVLKAMGKEKGRDYETVLINQKSHAGYYPGATQITLKLIFSREGELFGAQIVGQDGVDKRIDTIAAVMRLKGGVHDLTELELAYAPPYSSAKDPVNMLGYVAENVLDGLAEFITWDEMDALPAAEAGHGHIILDIREDMERMVYQIPGSVHIPLGQLRGRWGELDRSALIIPYCAVGVRSYNASRILKEHGFERVKILAGGTSFYRSMHYKDEADEVERENEMREGGSMGGRAEETGQRAADTVCPACEQSGGNPVEPERQMTVLDCCGLQCPGPIMKVHESIGGMADGDVLRVSATDMGFAKDIDSWCRRTGNTLLSTERQDKENIVYIQKGTDRSGEAAQAGALNAQKSALDMQKSGLDIQKSGLVMQMGGVGAQQGATAAERPDGKTIVVFSGDMDKVLASFIIANGAAAMGRQVTMFFTFWGLNALRKTEKQHVKKTLIEKMFGMMMPRGSKKLKLSKMNMGGMGTRMMKKVMADKNVDSLEALMKQAMKNGVKLVACTMSMDVMGIRPEEIIDGVEFAGVASYLGDAENSDVNLFV